MSLFADGRATEEHRPPEQAAGPVRVKPQDAGDRERVQDEVARQAPLAEHVDHDQLHDEEVDAEKDACERRDRPAARARELLKNAVPSTNAYAVSPSTATGIPASSAYSDR